MTLQALDRVKLAKVLELLRSPHDGEKLAAVARANEMLERAGLTWTEFCDARSRSSLIGDAMRHAAEDVAASRFSDMADAMGYGAGFARARRGQAKPSGGSATDWKPTRVEIMKFAHKVAAHPQFHGLPNSARMLVFQLALVPSKTVSTDELELLIEIAKLLKIEVPA